MRNPPKDPRIKLVAEVMVRTRLERMKRMIEVGDLRRADGRVSTEAEAKAILAALDEFHRPARTATATELDCPDCDGCNCTEWPGLRS